MVDDKKQKRRFPDPAWAIFGKHPILQAMKEIGHVDNSGVCPIIDMREHDGRRETKTVNP